MYCISSYLCVSAGKCNPEKETWWSDYMTVDVKPAISLGESTNNSSIFEIVYKFLLFKLLLCNPIKFNKLVTTSGSCCAFNFSHALSLEGVKEPLVS